KARTVRFVDHHERLVFVCQITYFIQRSYRPIHGESSICHDYLVTCTRSSLQLYLKICHITVFVAKTLCLTQTYTIDDGRMVQGVRNNSILWLQQWLKYSAIGIKCCGIQNGVVCTQEFCYFSFQLFVDILCTTYKTHRRHTITVA